MESDQRPHRTKSSSSTASTSTSELFICFTTSRLSSSSSSMKLSSKSLLSPCHARGGDPNSQISLSSSLSRRLKTSGSIKGGQASPMFPNGGTNKKRGCGIENPEPSSPKVTCIGQVRVKTKKQGKKMRIITRSRRRGSEASFRRTESSNNNSATQSQDLYNNNFQGLHFPNHQISSSHSKNQQECLRQRNQRWVHLPLTICEALRAFGSEFNCLFPNRSSCLANDKEKEESSSSKEVRSEGGGSSSCGAVFARWFVALQDGDGKGREIELVVEEDQERTEKDSDSSGGRSQRRQLFEGIEFKEERFNEGGVEEEEGGGRVSICAPPKNALLLMRCRSDPVKMAALANRFWEMPAAAEENEQEDQEENNEGSNVKAEKGAGEVVEKMETGLEAEAEAAEREDGECEEWVTEGKEHGELEELESLGFEEDEELKKDLGENPEKCLQIFDEVRQIEEKVECQVEEEFFEQDEEQEWDATGQRAVSEDTCSTEVVVDPENMELEEQAQQEQEEDEEREEEVSEAKVPESSIDSVQSEELEEKTEAEVAEESTEEETETVMVDRPEPEPEPEHEPELDNPNTQLGAGSKNAGQKSVLPDCLLLMMCEPKLSMEVSKETWVCSTDFIRCLPERHVKKIDGPDKAKKRVSIDSKPPLAPVVQQPITMQPPRSSCSFPVQSMATMIGQKLVGSAAYEPFVLTRCKSEPMRSAAKLAAAPETCFWKNRKLEPHRQAAMGVGAAGVGF
ncbi:hypothetical protein ACFX2I_030825 [Malus domestica]